MLFKFNTENFTNMQLITSILTKSNEVQTNPLVVSYALINTVRFNMISYVR
jgi:hypothetical protein